MYILILLLTTCFCVIECANIAVFDSGMNNLRKSIKNEGHRYDFSTDNTHHIDIVGHGSSVSGLIAGSNPKCMGVSPTATIHTYKVFNVELEAETWWLLEAFNHAIHNRVDVINFSIGDFEFADSVFRNKIREVTANGIIIVAAMGNDGPKENTIRSPADMIEVISVGSLSSTENKLAPFSSRGTPYNMKPDIVTRGHYIQGDSLNGLCRTLTGTSMSTPLVSGTVDLMIERFKALNRSSEVNVASIKQLLIYTSDTLEGENVGKLNTVNSVLAIDSFRPHVSLFPPRLNLYGKTQFNVTILNSISVTSWIESRPRWKHPTPLEIDYSDIIWPWCGYITIGNTGINEKMSGELVFTVVSSNKERSEMSLFISISV